MPENGTHTTVTDHSADTLSTLLPKAFGTLTTTVGIAMVRVWFGEQAGGIKELFECVGEAQNASAALSRTFFDTDRYCFRDE